MNAEDGAEEAGDESLENDNECEFDEEYGNEALTKGTHLPWRRKVFTKFFN